MKQSTLTEKEFQRVADNVDFAKALAKKFYSKRTSIGVSVEDYLGAAYLGLCHAAQRFDERKGMDFKTYAYFRIQGAMSDYLRNEGPVKIPRKATKAGQERERRKHLPHSFAASASELVSLLDVIEEVNLRIYCETGKPDIQLSYANQRDPESSAALKISRQCLHRLVQSLPEQQKRLIELRYFQECTFPELKKHFEGMSKSWVSRVHSQALDSLRIIISREIKEENVSLSTFF